MWPSEARVLRELRAFIEQILSFGEVWNVL